MISIYIASGDIRFAAVMLALHRGNLPADCDKSARFGQLPTSSSRARVDERLNTTDVSSKFRQDYALPNKL